MPRQVIRARARHRERAPTVRVGGDVAEGEHRVDERHFRRHARRRRQHFQRFRVARPKRSSSGTSNRPSTSCPSVSAIGREEQTVVGRRARAVLVVGALHARSADSWCSSARGARRRSRRVWVQHGGRSGDAGELEAFHQRKRAGIAQLMTFAIALSQATHSVGVENVHAAGERRRPRRSCTCSSSHP